MNGPKTGPSALPQAAAQAGPGPRFSSLRPPGPGLRPPPPRRMVPDTCLTRTRSVPPLGWGLGDGRGLAGPARGGPGQGHCIQGAVGVGIALALAGTPRARGRACPRPGRGPGRGLPAGSDDGSRPPFGPFSAWGARKASWGRGGRGLESGSKGISGGRVRAIASFLFSLPGGPSSPRRPGRRRRPRTTPPGCGLRPPPQQKGQYGRAPPRIPGTRAPSTSPLR